MDLHQQRLRVAQRGGRVVVATVLLVVAAVLALPLADAQPALTVLALPAPVLAVAVPISSGAWMRGRDRRTQELLLLAMSVVSVIVNLVAAATAPGVAATRPLLFLPMIMVFGALTLTPRRQLLLLGGTTAGLVGVILLGLEDPTAAILIAVSTVAVGGLGAVGSRMLAQAARAVNREWGDDRRTLQRLRSLQTFQKDFVATFSHEVRTPLTVIDGAAATLDTHGEQLTDEQRATLLGRLRANSTTLRGIVTSLLDTEALDRGLLTPTSSHVRIDDLVDGALTRLAPLLSEHEVARDLTEATVDGDPDLLERVIDNLLVNAARHTPAGTRVTAAVRRRDGVAEVEVRDDGPGIDAQDLDRITSRFERGSSPQRAGGLGIGLALASEVLRLHGARLEIDSRPGHGTAFSFELPLPGDEGVEVPVRAES